MFQDAAATKIQKVFRGHRVRTSLSQGEFDAITAGAPDLTEVVPALCSSGSVLTQPCVQPSAAMLSSQGDEKKRLAGAISPCLCLPSLNALV